MIFTLLFYKFYYKIDHQMVMANFKNFSLCLNLILFYFKSGLRLLDPITCYKNKL